jgi:hypothetical protein
MVIFDLQNSSHRAEVNGGQERDDHHNTIDGLSWISGPSQTYIQQYDKTGLPIICDWGRQIKANLCITAIQ